MKRIIILASSVLLLAACSGKGNDIGKARERDFSKVEARFADPGKEFRPAPLWTWNAKVNHDDIDRMLKDFKDQGFGGAFVHPRPGLVTEYLSDDWFELWRYSVEKGKELGLDIWIYDENSYPSGFAGGHVQHEMPQSYNHPTGFHVDRTDLIPGDSAKDCAVCLKREGDGFIDITGRTDEYLGRKGDYYIYSNAYCSPSPRHGGLPYVDLLYPGVTEKFIDITMSGYEKEFGKELGPVVKGIFTDETRFQNWTPGMFEEFEKDWGYDLRTHLPMLLEEIGNWKQVRFHFTSTKLRLFIEHWSKPWDKYCRDHGLTWTGHYWEHSWPRLEKGIDNMAMYAYHHMPAIDMLFNGFDETSPYAQWGNVRAVKELRSVANQMGYARTLCESYGGGGWNMTFNDFKRLADWEYALGVNFMNQHYSNVTTEGVRKFDYPDFFTGYSPWAEDYKTLNDHVARLSLVLSQGDQNNDILILEPTTTSWLYFTHRYAHRHVDELGFDFQALVTGLEHRQLEYDLGSETIIADHGSVNKGRFVVGEKAYSTVVIPPMTEVLLPKTAALLDKFARQGGKVIALARPELVNAFEDEALKDLWASGLENIKFELTDDVFCNDDVSFDSVSGGNLYHHRREYKDGQLLFLTNISTDESSKGTVTIKGSGLKELDTMDGRACLYACRDNGDGTVSFDFDIPSCGDLLLFAPTDADVLRGLSEKVRRSASDTIIEAVGDLEVRRLEDNCLTMDFCSVTVDGKTEAETFVADACKRLYNHFGWKNPWEKAIQYRTEFIDRDTLTTGNIDVEYEFIIAGDFDCSSMKLVTERPWLWEVSVNGHRLAAIPDEHPLDARNGAYHVGQYVHKGRNVARLHIDRMSIFAEIAHAFIFGDFSVVPDAKSFEIRAPHAIGVGGWPTQGMPFYGWGVSYSRKYNISDPSEGYVLKLNAWEGTECEVMVNGEKVGVVAYKPYELDITQYLQAGENTVAVVCMGSLASIYGPHYTPRGTSMGPKSWYGIEKRRPGSEYVFDAYGLHEPFDVCASRPQIFPAK